MAGHCHHDHCGFLGAFMCFWSRWVGCGFHMDRVWSTININISMIKIHDLLVKLPPLALYICPCRESSLRLRRLLSHIFVGLHCSFNSHICECSFPRIACGHYWQRVHCLLAEPSSSTSQDEGAQMFAEVGLHCNSDAKMRGESSRKYSTSDQKKERWRTPEVVSRHHDSRIFESFIICLAMGPSQPSSIKARDLQLLIQYVDVDADGFLTLSEFLELIQQILDWIGFLPV